MEIVVSGGGEELYSKNLRYFLRIEEDNQTSLNHCSSSNSGESHRNSTGLTSSAVLSEKGEHPPPVDEPPLQRVQSNRTLLDIIREDHTPGLDHSRRDGRRRWRHLKDKIRLRRRGNGLPCSSDSHLRNNHHGITMATRPPAIRFNSNTDPRESTQRGVSRPSSQRNPTRTESASGRFQQTIPPTRRSISEDNHQENEVEAEAEEGSVDRAAAAVGEGSPDQSVRTSLMALLAENDGKMDFECAAYIMEEDEKVIEEERGGAAAVNGGECNNCCICMVRHKGAAFIPCGHTFCRLCSRELWVQRGNCPLCNNYILEILDIF